MKLAAGRRRAVGPEEPCGEGPKLGLEGARHHEGQRPDRRRSVTGVADETRVFRVGDGVHADGKLVEIGAVRRTFVGLAVFGAHQELAGRDARYAQQRLVSHLL